MAEEKILTKHPLGKSGKNISKQKYDIMKNVLMEVLTGNELTHDELMVLVNNRLKGRFTGNISWYAETVKLDLEARKIIKRTAQKPQTYTVQ